MYVQSLMYLFSSHHLFYDLENVKCKLVEVHCDRYAFNLEKNNQICILFLWWWQLYISSAYMDIYKGMTYCIKIQK